jgi:hypothetical protein
MRVVLWRIGRASHAKDRMLAAPPPALLRFAPPAKIIDKPAYSAFAQGEHDGILQASGVFQIMPDMNLPTMAMLGEQDAAVRSDRIARTDIELCPCHRSQDRSALFE